MQCWGEGGYTYLKYFDSNTEEYQEKIIMKK